MNKTLMLVIPFIMFLLFSGCSQVQYLTGVELQSPHLGWQCDTSDYRALKAIYKDSLISLSVYVSSEPHDNFYDARFILFGPPLIPIIPNPDAIFHSDEIGIGFEILQNPDSLSYDVEKIHLLLEDGLVILPAEIYRTHNRTLRLNELIRDGRVGISFKLPRKDIEKFQVVFGKLIKENVSTVLPSLNYTRWSRYRWVFWMLLLR